jgi:hypothetical protein
VAADLGFGHAPTHGLHDAGAVGHKDAPVRGRHHPAHDGDVLVVERARVEADPDLAPAGGCRGRAGRPVPAGRARRAGAVRYPSSSTAIRQRTTAEHRARRRRPGQARHLPGTRGRLRRRGRVPQLQPRAFPGAPIRCATRSRSMARVRAAARPSRGRATAARPVGPPNGGWRSWSIRPPERATQTTDKVATRFRRRPPAQHGNVCPSLFLQAMAARIASAILELLSDG